MDQTNWSGQAMVADERRSPLGVWLKPLTGSDLEFAHLLAASPESGRYWKFRGATPSPEVLSRVMFDGFYCQYVVMHSGGARCGIAGLYNVNLASRFGYLHALSVPRNASATRTLVGAAIVADLAFRVWGFRKLYVEGPEPSLGAVGPALSRVAHEEGRLAQHEMFEGTYVDHVTYAVYAADWSDSVRRRFGLEG